MSAFDVAGTVVWTPLAVTWLLCVIYCVSHPKGDGDDPSRVGWNLVVFVILTLASTFCIARLFGAHA